MSQTRVHGYAVSLDGFGTGEGQNIDSPFGHAQGRLLECFFATRTAGTIHGETGGSTGVDDKIMRDWGTGDRRGNHGAQQVRPAARPVDRR